MNFSGERAQRSNPSASRPEQPSARRFFTPEGARLLVQLAHFKKHIGKWEVEIPANIREVAEKQLGWKFL